MIALHLGAWSRWLERFSLGNNADGLPLSGIGVPKRYSVRICFDVNASRIKGILRSYWGWWLRICFVQSRGLCLCSVRITSRRRRARACQGMCFRYELWYWSISGLAGKLPVCTYRVPFDRIRQSVPVYARLSR